MFEMINLFITQGERGQAVGTRQDFRQLQMQIDELRREINNRPINNEVSQQTSNENQNYIQQLEGKDFLSKPQPQTLLAQQN